MKIGVVKEVKDKEARVAMVPDGVARLVKSGNTVIVETDAGLASGFSNAQYQTAGAILGSTAQTWAVDLVVKVKEPQPAEYQYLNKQIIFTFFHLAGVAKSLTEALLKQGVTAIAYESVEDEDGRLPVLEPMSAIAGNMSVLMGSYHLASFNHGNGMQLGMVLGESFGKVVIIGDGVVGQHAAKVASAMGANVIVFGLNERKWLNQTSLATVKFIKSTKEAIAEQIIDTDLVVGAVLCRGEKAPKVLTEDMLQTMQTGAVVVDVSIDQGGCFETSSPTTHSDPVFVKHGIIHYCVSNMPGAYPKASTIALTNATIGYIQDIASNGLDRFISDRIKRKAINIHKGKIVSEVVARELGLLDLFQTIAE